MDSGDEDVEFVGGKRKANPRDWKDNKAKRLRAEGKAYINRKGETKLERRTGSLCR